MRTIANYYAETGEVIHNQEQYEQALAALAEMREILAGVDDAPNRNEFVETCIDAIKSQIAGVEYIIQKYTDRLGKWMIWSNIHAAWWRPSSHGYTTQFSRAGLYSELEAKKIVEGANRGGVINEVAIRVDANYTGAE